MVVLDPDHTPGFLTLRVEGGGGDTGRRQVVRGALGAGEEVGQGSTGEVKQDKTREVVQDRTGELRRYDTAGQGS